MTHERIEINPTIMFGKPVVKGTRMTVEQILRKLAGGMTIDEIVTDHPYLAPDDISAAAGFAADYLAQEEIIFAGGRFPRRCAALGAPSQLQKRVTGPGNGFPGCFLVSADYGQSTTE